MTTFCVWVFVGPWAFACPAKEVIFAIFRAHGALYLIDLSVIILSDYRCWALGTIFTHVSIFRIYLSKSIIDIHAFWFTQVCNYFAESKRPFSLASFSPIIRFNCFAVDFAIFIILDNIIKNANHRIWSYCMTTWH